MVKYGDGGWRLPHVKFLIKTQRIVCQKKNYEDYRNAWKLSLNFHLLITMSEVLFFFNRQRNYDKASFAKNIPKFYTECLIKEWKFTNRNMKFLRLLRFLIE